MEEGRLATLLASISMKMGMENSKTFTLDQVKGEIKLTRLWKYQLSKQYKYNDFLKSGDISNV